MQLHGRNMIGGRLSASTTPNFVALAPSDGRKLSPEFCEATRADADQGLELAAAAFAAYRAQPPEQIAGFLERIGEELLRLGDELLQRAQEETALPLARLTGERTRTVNQLRLFAELVREGSWVDARIDRAQPARQPAARPDLRRMLMPLGPVVVFGASNFPLAFSVCGGDTASALAAGCPVVFKAHPAHPGTSELAARAVLAAAEATSMPDGVFSLLHGQGHELGQHLVRHPLARAVGFTGSLRAGRALFDAAAARPEPIPVYAEMGSLNPVFVLPGALQHDVESLAQGLVQSVTLGVGQFCTNPGLVFGVAGARFDALAAAAAERASRVEPGTMLYPTLCERFQHGVSAAVNLPGVKVVGRSKLPPRAGQAPAVVLATDAATFAVHPELQDELFGPSTLLVQCKSVAELEAVAARLPGQLTATVHGTEEELAQRPELLWALQQKAGRLVFNGFPTGVEVSPAMHHGGPYPATTDAHFTSVGTAAIQRFARPICFQGFPESALPIELRNQNTRQLWRLVDGELTKADV